MIWDSAKIFLIKKYALPSARFGALGKVIFYLKTNFAEYPLLGTRHRLPLPSVTIRHSAK
jgi:hypothetical protein